MLNEISRPQPVRTGTVSDSNDLIELVGNLVARQFTAIEIRAYLEGETHQAVSMQVVTRLIEQAREGLVTVYKSKDKLQIKAEVSRYFQIIMADPTLRPKDKIMAAEKYLLLNGINLSVDAKMDVDEVAVLLRDAIAYIDDESFVTEN